MCCSLPSPKTFLAFWRFFNTYGAGQDSIQGLESERKGTIWYSSSVAGFVLVVGKGGVSFGLKGHIVRVTLVDSPLRLSTSSYVFGASGAVGALIWYDSSTPYFIKTFPRFAGTLTKRRFFI